MSNIRFILWRSLRISVVCPNVWHRPHFLNVDISMLLPLTPPLDDAAISKMCECATCSFFWKWMCANLQRFASNSDCQHFYALLISRLKRNVQVWHLVGFNQLRLSVPTLSISQQHLWNVMVLTMRILITISIVLLSWKTLIWRARFMITY